MDVYRAIALVGLLLVIVVVLDQQIAHEIPGLAVSQPAVLRDDDLDVEILALFTFELRQTRFDLGQAEAAEFLIAGLPVADHFAGTALDIVSIGRINTLFSLFRQ